jgi:hypothetical protein
MMDCPCDGCACPAVCCGGKLCEIYGEVKFSFLSCPYAFEVALGLFVLVLVLGLLLLFGCRKKHCTKVCDLPVASPCCVFEKKDDHDCHKAVIAMHEKVVRELVVQNRELQSSLVDVTKEAFSTVSEVVYHLTTDSS